MESTLGFWSSFGATLVLLVLALASGLRGGRRLHLWAGPGAIVALAVAIWFTEQLMQRYVFPPASLSFHLWFAKAGGLLALPVAVTGFLLWRQPRWRRWHRLAVFAFLAGVLLATATGLWLFVQGVPK